MEKERDSDDDRISKLPEFLIHQILSYLHPKEAAQTSLLSKTWLKSYSTSPILTFNERFFVKSPRIVDNRYPFFDFVNKTLSRYTCLNLRIHKFDITVFRVDHAPAYTLLDESLSLAFDNGVEELIIIVVATVEFSPYTLPPAMFDSLKLLTYLRVEECKFPQNVVSNSKSNSINFPFLRTLILNSSYINDEMLQKLLSSSPSLEKIVFNLVFGFNKFRVGNLCKLKILYIRSDKTIEIYIEDAPSLRLLEYRSCSNMPCLLKVGGDLQNQSMKRLKLFSVGINDNSLKELILKFPFLEHLEIDRCDELERISIASDSLMHLNLNCCKNLVEAKIDAPSLLELEYFGVNVLSLSLNNTPKELMTNIYLRHFGVDRLKDEWFRQLRGLLKSVTRARVSFTLLHLGINFDITLDLGENPIPLTTEIYMPEMNPSSSLFAVFVNTLFSSSRPTFIYSCWPAGARVDFMKFLSSELITATRDSNCCSSDHPTKCWRHYLEDVKVEIYEDSQEVWQPLHQETIQSSEFTSLDKMIRFSLKWYATLYVHV